MIQRILEGVAGITINKDNWPLWLNNNVMRKSYYSNQTYLNNIILYADDGSGNDQNQTSILRLTINQIISRFIPRQGIYPTLVKDEKLEIVSYKSFFYNPRTGRMNDGYPIEGEQVHPLICDYLPMITKFLHFDCEYTPMNSDELATRGRLWKAVNKATAKLLSNFLTKLENEQIVGLSGDTVGYDVSDCLLSLVMTQSPDGISFIGGNLFAIAKIGYNAQYWFDFNMVVLQSAFHYTDVVPSEIFEWICDMEIEQGIKGQHLIKFSMGLPLEDDYPSDILDKAGKQALGLKGVLPRLGCKTL